MEALKTPYLDKEIEEWRTRGMRWDEAKAMRKEFQSIKEALKRLEKLEEVIPTEEEMYAEMQRRFDLRKSHDMSLPVDDTQLGYEGCYDWMIAKLKTVVD